MVYYVRVKIQLSLVRTTSLLIRGSRNHQGHCWRKPPDGAAIWIGSILNAILSKIIKKIVNQNRPSELQTNSNVKLKPSDGGMPSSHAMSLGFIMASILIVDSVLPINNYNLRVSVGLVMSLYTTIALRYRIRDHYHTVEQVCVGLVLGVMNAIAWFKFAMVGNTSNNGVGPVLSYVQQNYISTETWNVPI